MGRTYQSTTVSAPLDKVWAVIRNFHDMGWAKSLVETVDVVGDKRSSEVGARRVLNDAIHETLLEVSDIDYTLKYRIDNGPGAISSELIDNYIGTVRAYPITDSDKTFVEWYSDWQGNDEDTYEFCHPIYVSLLKDLKKTFA